MRTSNPALSDKTFDQFGRGEFGATTVARPMTIEGTVNKTLILLLLMIIGAAFTWSQTLTPGGFDVAMPIALGAAVGGFIVSLVTVFKQSASPYTAPVYAVLEGLFLGAISALFNTEFPGIAAQAVGLTFATFAVMLFAYRARIINVNHKFRMGVIAATGGVVVFYLIMMVLRLLHITGPSMLLYSVSPLGIGISLIVIVIAALNLAMDFDTIEQGVARRAPAYMEWYCGFSLLVTLVWLYIEMLRLLTRLNSR